MAALSSSAKFEPRPIIVHSICNVCCLLVAKLHCLFIKSSIPALVCDHRKFAFQHKTDAIKCQIVIPAFSVLTRILK